MKFVLVSKGSCIRGGLYSGFYSLCIYKIESVGPNKNGKDIRESKVENFRIIGEVEHVKLTIRHSR